MVIRYSMAREFKQVNLPKFPVGLYERLKKIAIRHRRPVTQEIIWALEQYANLTEKKVNSGVTYHVDTE